MRVMIVGGGKVGYYMAKTLLDHGHQPIVIEKDRKLCSQVANDLDIPVTQGDGSTVEYLISFRISKAKELLITEPRTEIQAVAHRTGFTDASHFIATFRRITKITPAEFRRQN